MSLGRFLQEAVRRADQQRLVVDNVADDAGEGSDESSGRGADADGQPQDADQGGVRDRPAAEQARALPRIRGRESNRRRRRQRRSGRPEHENVAAATRKVDVVARPRLLDVNDAHVDAGKRDAVVGVAQRDAGTAQGLPEAEVPGSAVREVHQLVSVVRAGRGEMRDPVGRVGQLHGDGAAPDLRHCQRSRGCANDDQGLRSLYIQERAKSATYKDTCMM